MNSRVASHDAFDAMLRRALIDKLDDEADALPSKQELNHMYTFSEAHKNKMTNLFAKNRRSEILASFVKWGKRAAIFIIITSTVLLGTLMLSSDVRAAVRSVIIRIYEQFTRFEFSDVPTEEQHWELTKIPEGYELNHYFYYSGHSLSYYINPTTGRNMSFTFMHGIGITAMDNEDMDISIVVLDGVEYHVFVSLMPDKNSAVIWQCSGYQFSMDANLGFDDILALAKSVQVVG
jgi:hypothetical protein